MSIIKFFVELVCDNFDVEVLFLILSIFFFNFSMQLSELS